MGKDGIGIVEGFDNMYRVLKFHINDIEGHRLRLLDDNEKLKKRVTELETIEKEYNAMVGVLDNARRHLENQSNTNNILELTDEEKEEKRLQGIKDFFGNMDEPSKDVLSRNLTFIMEKNGNLERKS